MQTESDGLMDEIYNLKQEITIRETIIK